VHIMQVIYLSLSIRVSAREPCSHLKVNCISLCFVSAPPIPHFRDLRETWLNVEFTYMICRSHFGSMSTSYLKGKCLCQRHISHILWMIFVKLGSNVNAKGMSQLFWLKVEVTPLKSWEHFCHTWWLKRWVVCSN